MAEMSPSKALTITQNPEDYTVQERKDAKKVLDAYATVDGGGKGVGRGTTAKPQKGPKPRPKSIPARKSAMKDGGMAYGKKHMYAAGGSVTMNPGLKALKAKSPEAFKKITG